MTRKKKTYSDFYFSYNIEVYDKRTNNLLGCSKGWARRDTTKSENSMFRHIGMFFEFHYKTFRCIEENMDYRIISKEKKWDNPNNKLPEEK